MSEATDTKPVNAKQMVENLAASQIEQEIRKQVDKKVEEILAAKLASGTSPAPAEPGAQIVNDQGAVAPPGYHRVVFENGTVEYHKTIKDFNPRAVVNLHKRLDEAYQRTRPTEEVPDKPEPTTLLVNSAFRKALPKVRSWGDPGIPIEVCNDGRRLKADSPDFKFINE